MGDCIQKRHICGCKWKGGSPYSVANYHRNGYELILRELEKKTHSVILYFDEVVINGKGFNL